MFPTHLTVFDKIGVDWTASVTPRPPLQVVHVRLMSLRRADDDRGLWSRTVTSSVRRQVDRVSLVLGQEALVALVALHGMKRRRSLQERAGRGAELRICDGEIVFCLGKTKIRFWRLCK